MQVAVAIDAVAVNVLQDQKPPVVRSRAGIEQPRDVRMGEPREHLSLAAEALRQLLLRNARVEELDGALGFEAPIAAACEPDLAHSAPTEQTLDRVVADAPAVVRQADCH